MSCTQLTSGLDIWLYFLRHAEKIEEDAVPAPLQQPLVLRALEELKMLKQTDLECEKYESRRKAQLDYNTGLKVARMEGHEEGREEGVARGKKIGIIQMCERVLNRSETPTDQMSLDELTRLADELQELVRKRG
ncbi:MAG: PD-(D/E)XK nuclease family transposase [Planctomycetes bacterium]|nr:PD-(D/E)XK nuclease family transposase [Planctomycetota bacterium]